MSLNPFKQASDASKFSVQQIQQGLQNGTIPSYIGIPLIEAKMKQSQQAKALAAGQQKPPTIAEQVMAQAQQEEAQNGLDALPSNLPTEYRAAGGIIAFADGGEAEDEDMPTFTLPDEEDEAAQDAEDEAMYGSLSQIPRGRVAGYAQTFEQGIGSLPAAEKSGGKEDTLGFIDRILHKESRGQRYGKDGNLLTSPKGAQGEMQVMPGTSRDPGFGVKPARDDSPDELARVGRDYANTLLDRYGDPKIAAIAYNMGPGATDKWLAAGADFSKLPKETKGYVQGFKEGGAIRFQNRGIVDALPEDDFTSIPGLLQDNTYERALRRAKGIQDEETKPRYTPGKLPNDMQMRLDANYRDSTSNPGIIAGTTYADALAKAKGNPPAVDTTPSIKDTLLQDAAAKQQSRGYVADKISNSDYARQMGNVGGFFGDMGKDAISGLGTLGKHLVSAPGYGFSSQSKPADTPAATQQKPYDFTQFDKATDRYMNDRDQARLANARANEEKLRAEVAATKAGADTGTGTGAKTVTEAAAPESAINTLLGKREANLEKQRSVDNYMALLSAGLGMMGGTSPNAFANIGAGAQQGIANLMQSNKLRAAEENAILSGRLGQERYRNSNALQEARLAESKMNRERLTRADLADNLRNHEQQAERMAITQIGQDKLGALDPAAQAAAIARKKAEILNSSATFQTQMKEYMGSGYTSPQQTATGGASYSYDPKNRKLSGI